MVAGISATNVMISVYVYIFLKVLVGLDESFRIFGAILEMDIVVGYAMANKERAMES